MKLIDRNIIATKKRSKLRTESISFSSLINLTILFFFPMFFTPLLSNSFYGDNWLFIVVMIHSKSRKTRKGDPKMATTRLPRLGYLLSVFSIPKTI